MKPQELLADVSTRERTNLRIHTAVGVTVLAIFGGLSGFAFWVMSSADQPSSFGVASVSAAANDATNSVQLAWTAPGDDGNVGQASSYDIRYSTGTLNESTWGFATTVVGEPAPQPAGSAESFIVPGLQPNTTYNFGVKTTDDAGNTSTISNIAAKTTAALSIPNCVENWSCQAWSACTSGQQSRTCADQAGCGTTSNRPALTRACTVQPDGTTTLPGGQSGTTNDVAPNTVVTSAPTASHATPRFTFTWNGVDDVTSPERLQFSYRLDTRAWSSWTLNNQVVLRDLRNGRHTFTVRARDASGNVDPSPATTTFTVQLQSFVVVGIERNAGPRVRLYSPTGQLQKDFFAFESNYRGGVQVLAADLGDDGQSEVIVAPNAGRRGEVRIFRQDGSRISSFLPYGANYRDGVNLAVADVNGDGPMEIIVAKQRGTPNVRVFGFRGGRFTQVYREFNGESANIRNGLSLAAGDLNGDGRDEVITVAAGGTASTLRVYRLQGTSMRLVAQRGSILGSVRSGFSVTTADLANDGTEEIIVGPRSNAVPTIRIFVLRGSSIAQIRRAYTIFRTNERAGVRLSSADVNGDGREDVVASYGGTVQPKLTVFSGANLATRLRVLSTFSVRDRLVLTHSSGT